MDEPAVGRILVQLGAAEARAAWAQFLDSYAPLIIQVVRLFEREPDSVADCFLFVCEHLSANGFRRLRRFQPGGAASFSTWLRAVVRNLCLDWHRKEFGRHRAFEAIRRLPRLEQEVFRLQERGFTTEQIQAVVSPEFSGLKVEAVAEAQARICQVLTPRQLWLLQAREARTEPLAATAAADGDAPALAVPDPGPDPESQAVQAELRRMLATAVGRLLVSDRLLLRLRFEQALPLQQVAQLAGLKDAQSADRRIREILGRLRTALGP